DGGGSGLAQRLGDPKRCGTLHVEQADAIAERRQVAGDRQPHSRCRSGDHGDSTHRSRCLPMCSWGPTMHQEWRRLQSALGKREYGFHLSHRPVRWHVRSAMGAEGLLTETYILRLRYLCSLRDPSMPISEKPTRASARRGLTGWSAGEWLE